MTYRGVVRGNVIVLQAGVQLPEGTEVEVIPREGASGGIPREEQDKRKALGIRMVALSERLASRHLHLAEATIEARQELEERLC